MRALRRRQSCHLVSDSTEQPASAAGMHPTAPAGNWATTSNKCCAKQMCHARTRKKRPIKTTVPNSSISKIGSAVSNSLQRKSVSFTGWGSAIKWDSSGFLCDPAVVKLPIWLARAIRM